MAMPTRIAANRYAVVEGDAAALADAAAPPPAVGSSLSVLLRVGALGESAGDVPQQLVEKGLTVAVAVGNVVCMTVFASLWASTVAAVLWGVLFGLASLAMLAYFVAAKSHAPLRVCNLAAGPLFLLVAVAGERCQPLTRSGGRLVLVALPALLTAPATGVPDAHAAAAALVHAALYVALASAEGAGAECLGGAAPPPSNVMGVVFAQAVLPVAIAGALGFVVARSQRLQQAQAIMSERFGVNAIRAAQKGDVAALEAAVQEYDESNPPLPSMSDDAIGILVELIKGLKRLAPPSPRGGGGGGSSCGGLSPAVLAPAPTRKSSARALGANTAERSPATHFLTAPENIASANFSRSSNDSSLEDGDESETSATESRVKAKRRRSSRLSSLIEKDGEVCNSAAAAATVARGMWRGGRFIVAFSLPRLVRYATRSVASLDLARIFLTEFVDNVHSVCKTYDGALLFRSFHTIFVSFEWITNACAASVRLVDLVRKDSSHHRDTLLNETRAHMPLVVILHAEVMHGSVGSEWVAPTGCSPAERVFHQIIDVLPNVAAAPPCIVISRSLEQIASESFNVEAGPHPKLSFLTSAKAVDDEGLPCAPPPPLDAAAAVEFALPEFEDLAAELASAMMEHAANGEAQSSEVQVKPGQEGAVAPIGGGGRRHRSRLPPEVLDVWKRFDVDDNGHLDLDEVRDMLTELGFHMDEEELHQFFSEIDHDGSGTLSLDEFQTAFFSATLGGQSVMAGIRRAAVAMASNTGGENLPIVLNAWKKYDKDGSGALDAEELGALLKDLGIEKSEEEVLWLLNSLDRSGSGRIEFDEFAALFSEDDSVNAKLTEVRERIQTVTRVMTNKSSGKTYSGEGQDLRDQRNAIAALVEDYGSLPLFAYSMYNAPQNLYRVAMGPELDISPAHMFVDILLDTIFISWMLAKLLLIPIEVKGQVIFRSKDIFMSRIRKVECWLDIVIALPLDILFFALGQPGVIGYFRANKILLVYYLDPLYTKITRRINPALGRAVNAALYFFMFCNGFTALVILVAREVGEENMRGVVGTETLISDQRTTWLKAFYWSILTLAGQLRGEVIPRIEVQVLLLLASVMVGLPLYTVILGAIGNAVTVEDSYTRYLTKIDSLRSYFEYTELPKHMEHECVAYYHHIFETTGSLDITAYPLDDLPVELSVQITIQIGQDMLKSVPIFKDASTNLEFVHELTTKLVPKVIDPGALVMRKGDRGTNMYFVTHGDFNVVLDDGTVVFTLRKGNFFGEIALLHNVKRTATIVCGPRYANVLILDKKHFDEVTTTFPDCLSQVYKAAEERIKQMLEKEKAEAKEAKEKRRKAREAARLQAVKDGTTPRQLSGDSDSDSGSGSGGGGAASPTTLARKRSSVRRRNTVRTAATVARTIVGTAGERQHDPIEMTTTPPSPISRSREQSETPAVNAGGMELRPATAISAGVAGIHTQQREDHVDGVEDEVEVFPSGNAFDKSDDDSDDDDRSA